MLLDERGPAAFADVIGSLANGAVLDSRVLLAHRLGSDEIGLAVGGRSVRERPSSSGRDSGPVAAGR